MAPLVDITIIGSPVTAKNGSTPFFNRKTKKMMAFKKPALTRWERDALRQFTGAHRLRIDYPVNVAIEVWPYRDGRADLVGYIQAVNDVLTKAEVIVDDCGWHPVIVRSHDGSRIVGVDKKNPRIRVTITKAI